MSPTDRKTFQNEDLVLRVNQDVDPHVWDASKYEGFLDELCGFREYQKDAIRTTMAYLLGRRYRDLRSLARENFEKSPVIQERFGSWRIMQDHLQFPDKLSCSIDQATGTGKSYVLYGIAAILLAEGAVDRVLVLCPSNTIEYGLLRKFRELAEETRLREALPSSSKVKCPLIKSAAETIVSGAVCIENYHAILENTKSSIRQSLHGSGDKVAVLNDEAHHVANEVGGISKKWKEFLEDPAFGFRYVVGVSGTCYVGDEYFADVVHRYSLRRAIEDRTVKTVEYVDELPPSADNSEEKWQLIYNRHSDWKKKLKSRAIRPLSIVVTKAIADAERVSLELCEFLAERESVSKEVAQDKVLCVTSASRHADNLSKLRLVDSNASKVEWIVSVSMLTEGWDVKNVFQIIPHEERAFNSKLLIAQVLGRGLRRPEGWVGEDPVVTVFNHDAWSTRIRHLVNEVLEIEKRLTAECLPRSGHNFDVHTLDYTRVEDSTTFAKKGEYKIFADGVVDLPTQVESEDVVIPFVRVLSDQRIEYRTTLNHKTWSASEIAEQMYQRLRSIDEESTEGAGAQERTEYAKRFPLKKCQAIVEASLKRANIKSGRVTDENRQRFLQALGTLRRKAAKRVVYKLSPRALRLLNTKDRPKESCSAADIRRGSKTIFFPPSCEETLIEEQRQFFRDLADPDGEYRIGAEGVATTADFKTPLNLAIADGTPERKFIRHLVDRQNASKIDAWIKNSPIGFYSIEYAWKKGEHQKRGQFNPDFFIRQGDRSFCVEIKGDEELREISTENVRKHEYASRHFDLLNDWLTKSASKLRYQFNMVTPKSYSVFFQKLRDCELVGFRSDIDVIAARSAKSTA